MLEYIESLEKSLFEESEIVKDLTKELIEGIIKN
jgi:hypothetical protein